jgi:hypothetical protein
LADAIVQARFQVHRKRDDPIRSQTEDNLHRLQHITDEVKLLTKQIHLSIDANRNSDATNGTLIEQDRRLSCSVNAADARLLAEVCFQLERRILILIFQESKHFFGFSLRSIISLIDQEDDVERRIIYQQRFRQIEDYLRSSQFNFVRHARLTFDLINTYGIYPDYFWLKPCAALLSNTDRLKSTCSLLCRQVTERDIGILIDSLVLISKYDGHPLFHW